MTLSGCSKNSASSADMAPYAAKPSFSGVAMRWLDAAKLRCSTAAVRQARKKSLSVS